MLTEAKAFGFILAVVLFLASLVLSFHEGETFQGDKDKVVAQALQIASQKALQDANDLADKKERDMQSQIDVIATNAETLAKDNDAKARSIADFQSGKRQLLISLSSCRSQQVPGDSKASSQSNDGAIAVVSNQVAARLESDRQEHNDAVVQIQELQNVVRVYEGVPQVPIVRPDMTGVPTDVIPPAAEIPS